MSFFSTHWDSLASIKPVVFSPEDFSQILSRECFNHYDTNSTAILMQEEIEIMLFDFLRAIPQLRNRFSLKRTYQEVVCAYTAKNINQFFRGLAEEEDCQFVTLNKFQKHFHEAFSTKRNAFDIIETDSLSDDSNFVYRRNIIPEPDPEDMDIMRYLVDDYPIGKMLLPKQNEFSKLPTANNSKLDPILLSKLLVHIKFFDQFEMSDRDRRDVCGLMEYCTIPEDRTVFSQGDKGTLFYIILHGAVTITVYDPNNDTDVSVAELSNGDAFGELALLTDEPRRATVKTTKKCSLAMLNRDNFLSTLTVFHERLLAKKISMLMKVHFLMYTPRKIIEDIAMIAATKNYLRDDVVIQQGSMDGSGIYIVRRGTLRVVQEIQKGLFVQINELTPGACFGEISVIKKIPRSCSVIASSSAELLEVGRFDVLKRIDAETLTFGERFVENYYPTTDQIRDSITKNVTWIEYRERFNQIALDPTKKEHLLRPVGANVQRCFEAKISRLNFQEINDLSRIIRKSEQPVVSSKVNSPPKPAAVLLAQPILPKEYITTKNTYISKPAEKTPFLTSLEINLERVDNEQEHPNLATQSIVRHPSENNTMSVLVSPPSTAEPIIVKSNSKQKKLKHIKFNLKAPIQRV